MTQWGVEPSRPAVQPISFRAVSGVRAVPSPRGTVMAIAPEQCIRLLHQIDTDLDEMISLEDMQAFVHRHSLPIGVEEMAAMFDEANVARNGLLDIDQLEKAVSGKFPHRTYNEAWRRLFIEAPTGQSKYENGPIRLTQLQDAVPTQSTIRASYEQEGAVMTFAPNTSQSKLSYSSSSRKTLTFPGGGSTMETLRAHAGAPLLRPFAPAPLGPGENADENLINALIRPGPADGNEASPAPPLRCGFDSKVAFEARVARTKLASDAEGWRDRLPQWQPPRPSPLYYGVHPVDFTCITTLHNGKMPLRTDGSMRRGKFVAPLRLLNTENSGVGTQNSAKHRAWAQPSDAAISDQEFISVFKRRNIQQEKMTVATDRLAGEGTLEYPRPNQYMMGKPSPHAFRDDIKKLDLPGGGHDPRTLFNGKPDFITAVGRFWPRNELKQPDVLATEPGEPSLRVGMTENLHRGNSRSSWPPGGPKGSFANGPFGSAAALRSRGA
eukprot:scaffold78014_cov75-Phaeocystis_antarctica.AAC.3